METYTIIKKGSSIQHCIKIPEAFVDKELEITIRPYQAKQGYRERIEGIYNKHKSVRPFNEIKDSVEWQRETRRELSFYGYNQSSTPSCFFINTHKVFLISLCLGTGAFLPLFRFM